MTDTPLPLAVAAGRLAKALQCETELAHAGALPDLAAAADAKRDAFAAFMRSRDAAPDDVSPRTRTALQDLLAAADENAVVLEAVTTTLEHTARGLRNALSAAADPGTYGPTGPRPRHVLAARLDAKV
jgi:hypothetical protein